MTTPAFEKFITNDFVGRLITIDPGETTGYSIWDKAKLTECGQLNTFQVRTSVGWLKEWINEKTYKDTFYNTKDLYCVIEEYRVYGNKTDDHAQSTMHTSRLIGALECLLMQRGINYHTRMAVFAKKWATDEKLKDWGFYSRGERHARDAVRHGCYFYHHDKVQK